MAALPFWTSRPWTIPRQRASLRTWLSLAIILWLAAEATAFMLVVDVVGGGGALLIGIATGLLGLARMKRLGAAFFEGLRRGRALERFTLQRGGALEGSLAGLGAALLVLPGFLTDGIGLLLGVPLVRSRLARALGGRPVTSRDHRSPSPIIDLDPNDWRPGEDPRQDPRGDPQNR